MNAEQARERSFQLYLISLAAALFFLFAIQFHQPSFDLVGNAAQVIGLYAVPLSIIVTAISSRKATTTDVTKTALVLLFGSTYLWNGLILLVLSYYALSAYVAVPGFTPHLADATAKDFLNSIPGKLTFLISGALTYFFVGDLSKSTAEPSPPS